MSRYINRETPPDLSPFEEIPFEARVAVILSHSMDYPSYVNHGWIVDEEYQEIADNFNMSMCRREGPNIGFNDADMEMFLVSNGELNDTQRVFELDNRTSKIGDTEYYWANGE